MKSNFIKIVVFFIVMISTLNLFSQNKASECDYLKEGTFEIYFEGSKEGIVFRKDNVQIEKYLNSKKLTYVKIKPNECNYLFNAYYVKEKVDTITFSVDYIKVNFNHFKYIAKPKYLKIDYTVEGEIKKISDSISNEYLILFEELIKKEKNN